MEAFYLVCSVRKPQLKRGPLGCGPALTFITMDTRLLVSFENQGQCARTNSCWFGCVARIQPFNGIRRFEEGSMQVRHRDARPGPA
jgi:hypothetical protein